MLYLSSIKRGLCYYMLLKKEKLLLEVRRTIDQGTKAIKGDIIAAGLPYSVLYDLFQERSKLEH